MKIFSPFAFGLLVLLTLPTAGFAFNDVPDTHPQKISIDYLQDTDIIKGYNDGTFRPEQQVNRAEMTKILLEGLNISPDESQYKNCFPDVMDEWFARYVCYAKANNILSGYDDGLFRPANPINTVEALKIMFNVNNIVVPTPLSLDTPWYIPYLSTADSKRFLEKSQIEPANAMTRGGIADLYFRLLVTKEAGKNIYSPQVAQTVVEQKTNKKTDLEDLKIVKRSFEEEKNTLLKKVSAEVKNTEDPQIDTFLSTLEKSSTEVDFWERFDDFSELLEDYYEEHKKDFESVKNDEDAEDAGEEINEAEEKIEKAINKIKRKETEGKNVEKALARIEEAKATLSDAKTAFAEENWDEVESLVDQAKKLAMWARGKDIKSEDDENDAEDEKNDDSDNEDGLTSEQQAQVKITESEAKAIAQNAYTGNGQFSRIKTDIEDGIAVYEARFTETNGGETKIEVHAETGEVLGIEVNKDSTEDDENDGKEEDDDN